MEPTKHDSLTEEYVTDVTVPVEAPKVTVNLVVRAIIYVVAIINAVIAYITGTTDAIAVNTNFIYEGVSLVFTIGAFGHAYFYNQNLTKRARKKAVVTEQVENKKLV